MRLYCDSWKLTCKVTAVFNCWGEYWYVIDANCIGMVFETEFVDELLE